MSEERGARAARLLLSEAWAASREGRYQSAAAAARRAVDAAERLDDPVLLVEALSEEANALGVLGDDPAALIRYTRILGLAEDPVSRGRLDDPRAARAVMSAYQGWVGCARYVAGIPVRQLFGVLDAAERWLTATGHPEWRSGVLLQRSGVHKSLGEADASLAAAEEALALKLPNPTALGYALSSHRCEVGEALLGVGRVAEATAQYRAAIDGPAPSQWDRRRAHEGLAWCALRAGDPGAARREARAALALAESLGDFALCTSLEVLAEACRADGDLAEAEQLAERLTEAASRVRSRDRPYRAALVSFDIALDRADLVTARQSLAGLEKHAAALDADTGTDASARETAQRRQRLAGIENRPG